MLSYFCLARYYWGMVVCRIRQLVLARKDRHARGSNRKSPARCILPSLDSISPLITVTMEKRSASGFEIDWFAAISILSTEKYGQ